MSHIPTRLDVITDLRRAILSSYSDGKFDNSNTKTFLEKAEKNLAVIGIKKNVYLQIIGRLKKAKDKKSSLNNRREDLLTASVLI